LLGIQIKMTKELYKSTYVIAKKRRDGTYGILRDTPINKVDCFRTPEEAEKHRDKNCASEEIVIDIGLIIDPNLRPSGRGIRGGKSLDVSPRLNR
tara:strand:+ start:1423 stop:1707 length:285 start_codon:yes stop_codon:yes gene_type:complete